MTFRIAFAFVLAVLIVGCGGKDGPSFRLGPPRVLEVDGLQEVTDPESGLTFTFPEGGVGTLTLREIVSAPDCPAAGGRGYQVEYDGAGELLVRVPVADDEEAACWAWGFLEGSADDGVPRDNRWVPVPGTDLGDGTWSYEWVLPFATAGTAAGTGRLSSALVPRSGHLGASQYWINSVKPGASEADRRVALDLQAQSDIDAWIDALPAGMQAGVRADVARLHPKTYYDGNYYIGFTRHLLRTAVTPMLGLRLDADENIIAHEVGHYMTHVLAGDQAYLAIENTAPDANHGVGTWQPGRPLVEDYAYFSQFFLTGGVGAADPTLPRTVLGGLDPRKVDLPGVEGFGTVMLASLVRTAPTTIALLSKAEEPVPVVAAPIGEVLALYAAGAVTVDDLWSHLENFVAARGKAGAVPVMAERAGWSYAATGRVLDEQGQPLEGVEVRNLALVDGTEYDTGKAGQAKTDKEGRFRLTRVFPGTSVMRLDLPSGPKDVPVTVDPVTPTTQEVDLGDLAGAGGPETVSWCGVLFQADFAWEGEPGLVVPFIEVNPPPDPVTGTQTFSGHVWEASWTDYPEAGVIETGTMRVVLSPAHDRVVSFLGEKKRTSGDEVLGESLLEGGDLPLVDHWDWGEWIFEAKGTAACDRVDRAERVERLDGNVPYMTVTGWTCNSDSSLNVSCR